MSRNASTREGVEAGLAAWEAEINQRVGGTSGTRAGAPMRAILAQLADLDLTPSEWHTVAWFIGWDALDNIANILGKVREAGRKAST